ncbi:MAG: L-aspartate oxidase [Thermoplasmata archaeon]
MPPLPPNPLIIGSGIAGLYVAIRARELGLRPVIVTKSRLEESNTRYAQGGIAAALGPDDSVALHHKDTLRAGDGLVDANAARVLTSEAPPRIADLVRLGVPFDTVEGQISLGREGAHSRSRILHAGGDATGLRIEETLRERAREVGIEARERTILRAVDAGSDRRLRAVLSRASGEGTEEVFPSSIVLATGGIGSLYRQTTNPAVATGEGVAIAFRGGALVNDMEFIQFHPTTFLRRGAPRFLISEALRGEGAILRNRGGERFMPRYHPAAELAPRDVVTRAIETELARSGGRSVYLDATAIGRDRLLARFPTICRFLTHHRVDPSRDPIPVAPVAHYMIGGVATDLWGRTSLRGLYAAGEVASTGVHGANRLGSNSLLEGLVFGERVVRALKRGTKGAPLAPDRTIEIPRVLGAGIVESQDTVEGVRNLLWKSVGIIRTPTGLSESVRRLEGWQRRFEPPDSEGIAGTTANAVLSALLIARAALTRRESRGAHFRTDFPRPRPGWRIRIGQRLVST